MFLSRLSRQWVVRFAVAMLLACQSVAVVHARVLGTPPPDNTAAGSCHESEADSTGGDEQVFSARCQSQNASSTPSGVNVPAADSLPPIVVQAARFAAEIAAALPVDPPLLQVAPPPLSIVHCCLRN